MSPSAIGVTVICPDEDKETSQSVSMEARTVSAAGTYST